jgi:hypothetical protein
MSIPLVRPSSVSISKYSNSTTRPLPSNRQGRGYRPGTSRLNTAAGPSRTSTARPPTARPQTGASTVGGVREASYVVAVIEGRGE